MRSGVLIEKDLEMNSWFLWLVVGILSVIRLTVV